MLKLELEYIKKYKDRLDSGWDDPVKERDIFRIYESGIYDTIDLMRLPWIDQMTAYFVEDMVSGNISVYVGFGLKGVKEFIRSKEGQEVLNIPPYFKVIRVGRDKYRAIGGIDIFTSPHAHYNNTKALVIRSGVKANIERVGRLISSTTNKGIVPWTDRIVPWSDRIVLNSLRVREPDPEIAKELGYWV